MNKNKDIFEELKNRCGCSNISDLRTKYFRDAALHFLEKESFTRHFPENLLRKQRIMLNRKTGSKTAAMLRGITRSSCRKLKNMFMDCLKVGARNGQRKN